MKIRLVLAAVAVASSSAMAAPASATECTPRGCTGSCHLNSEFGTRDLRPVICYS